MKHLPIYGSDDSPILLETSVPGNNTNDNRFKLEAKWLLHKAFLDSVKPAWSNYVNGSYAYQLIKKTLMLRHVIKNWKNNKNEAIENHKMCYV